MTIAVALAGCGTHPLTGPCFTYKKKCKPRAEWVEIDNDQKRQQAQREERSRQLSEQFKQDQARARTRAKQWAKDNPEQARQAELEMQRYLSKPNNIYGCPGTMIPLGPPMYGCGYDVGL